MRAAIKKLREDLYTCNYNKQTNAAKPLIDTLLFGLSGFVWRIYNLENPYVIAIQGYYWSSKKHAASHSYYLENNAKNMNAQKVSYRSYGFSVRLMRG